MEESQSAEKDSKVWKILPGTPIEWARCAVKDLHIIAKYYSKRSRLTVSLGNQENM